MSETGTNRPCFLTTTAVFNDCHVTRLAIRGAVVICPEWIVSLEYYNISCAVSSKFSNLNSLNIGKFIPICISALIRRNPNVLTFAEITISVIPKNGDCVSAICSDSNIIVTITIEITYSDIMWVTICGIRPRLRSTSS